MKTLGKILLSIIKNWDKWFIGIATFFRLLEDSMKVKFDTFFDNELSSMGYNRQSTASIVFGSLHKITKVTSHYGERDYNGHKFHHGIDIQAEKGDHVYPLFKGKVVSVRDNLNDLGGRNVVVESEDGQTRYFVCHLSKVCVKVGDVVDIDNVIGLVGGSGKGEENAYAPHLHLEIRKRSGSSWVDVNPIGAETPSFAQSADRGGIEDIVQVPMKLDLKEIEDANIDAVMSEKVNNDDVYNSVVYFMKALGLTKEQACGIVGNLVAESRMKPHAYHKGGAQGLAQWMGNRVKMYKDRFGVEPRFDKDINHHIDHVAWEFQNTEKGALRKLKSVYSIEQCATMVFKYYERPNDNSLGERIRFSKEALGVVLGRMKKEINEKSVKGSTYDFKYKYPTMRTK